MMVLTKDYRELNGLEDQVCMMAAQRRDDLAAMIGDNTGSSSSPLLQAVSSGNYRAFDALLSMIPPDKMAEVFRSQDVYGNTVLHEAVARVDGTPVDVPEDTDPNDPIISPRDVLINLIVRIPEGQLVDVLDVRNAVVAADPGRVSDGDPPLYDARGGDTPITFAVEAGHADILQTLLMPLNQEQRRNVLSQRDVEGRPISLIIAANGHTDLVTILLQGMNRIESRAFVAQQRQTENGPNALHVAIDQGQLTFFDEVLDHILDPSPDPTDDSDEAEQIREERQAQIQSLILSGTPDDGKSVLHRAKTGQAVETILDYTPEGFRAQFIRFTDSQGEAALYQAAGKGRDDVVRALIAGVSAGERQGIREQENGADRQNALHNASTPATVEAFCDGLSSELRRRYADEGVDRAGRTPLACAIQRGDADVAQALLDGFTPEQEIESIARDRGGPFSTLLHQSVYAAGRRENPTADSLEFLLPKLPPHRRAELFARDREGSGGNILHMIVADGSVQVAELLLNALPTDSDRRALLTQTVMGANPARWAEVLENEELADFLQSALEELQRDA